MRAEHAEHLARRLDDHPVPGGRAPYSTVSAEPAKRWLNHIVMVPWHSPPQSSEVRGSRSARASRRAKPASLVSVSTPLSGWWKLITRRGSISFRNAITARVSGSLAGTRTGLVVAVEVGPVVGEVAVEVDAAGVAAGAARQPVGVVGRDHPQVDAADRPAVAQASPGSRGCAARCRAWWRPARSAACPARPAARRGSGGPAPSARSCGPRPRPGGRRRRRRPRRRARRARTRPAGHQDARRGPRRRRRITRRR